jgi:poly(A) polymerase
MMSEPKVFTSEQHGLLPGQIDPDALRVVRRLREMGHEAYIVGGAVRDLLLHRSPKDFDVASTATPEQIQKGFRNSRLIGRRFRIAHVYFKGGKVIEVSTFRREPDAGAGPIKVERANNEWGTAEDDARRRDLTINGLFLDPDQMRVIDYVGGWASRTRDRGSSDTFPRRPGAHDSLHSPRGAYGFPDRGRYLEGNRRQQGSHPRM